jgi:hypothetical protein
MTSCLALLLLACTTQTLMIDGKFTSCVTCCFAGHCTVTCSSL